MDGSEDVDGGNIYTKWLATWANAEFSIVLCGQQVRDQLVDTDTDTDRDEEW